MSKYDLLLKTRKKLYKINFSQVIKHEGYNNSFSIENNYDLENEHFNDEIKGYCDICDNDNEVENPITDDGKVYKLCNISHGSHTLDFLSSFGCDVEKIINDESENWSTTPVLFLMENPSYDYFGYDYLNSDKSHSGKRPFHKWYWIHCSQKTNFDNKKFEDDTYLSLGQYGKMVASLIYQNKFGNAYLTNLVKCGMSDTKYNENKNNNVEETGFLNLSKYSGKCKSNCIENVLSKEILALCETEMVKERIGEKKSLIVFAFGNRPYWIIKDFFENSNFIIDNNIEYKLALLPHPAMQLNTTFRKSLLKNIIKDTIKNQKFINRNKSLPTDDTVKNIFKKHFEDKLKYNIKRQNNYLSLRWKSEKSLFSNEELIKEVSINGGSKNIYIGNNQLGYNFVDEEYWGWDFDKEDYISEDEIRYFETFKKVIESIKSIK